jgi:hypothetical protein
MCRRLVMLLFVCATLVGACGLMDPSATPVGRHDSSAVPTIPPPPPPATMHVGEDALAPSHVGGCPTVFYRRVTVGSDRCGPDPYDLEAPSIALASGADVLFSAPTGWVFSAADVEALTGRPDAWAVTIAPLDVVENLPTDRQENVYLARGGISLGAAAIPTDGVMVFVPTKPGEYLLELRAAMSQDGWAWADVLYHWRVSIGAE